MYKFVVVHHGRIQNNIPLRHENLIIGRKQEADIHLEEKLVSARHARIYQKNDQVFIADLDSTNGTRVNGAGIKEVQLQTGDQISIGNYKLFFVTEHEDNDDPDATVMVSTGHVRTSSNQDKPAPPPNLFPASSKAKLLLLIAVLAATSVAAILLLTG